MTQTTRDRDAYLEINLAAIESIDPRTSAGLRELLRSDRQTYADLEIIEHDGVLTARVGSRYVHSPRRPWREAQRLAEAQKVAQARAVVCLGFGLGYVPECVARLRNTPRIVVYEPSPARFLVALGCRDMRALIESPELYLFVGTPPEHVAQALEGIGAAELRILPNRTLVAQEPETFDRLQQACVAATARADVNRNTLQRFGRRWIRNLTRNAGLLRTAKPVSDLFNIAEGMPALVAAGGPSLDRFLGELPGLAERCIVIAVDTSLKALVRAGVQPDFVVVVDPQYWNSRHLDWVHAPETAVISESSTYPRVFRTLGGPLFFCSSLFPLGRFLESAAGHFGVVGTGGSVATTAWDFARQLGASPIYMAGLDLGFPGNATHFRGSFFEERALTYGDRLSPAEQMAFTYLNQATKRSLPDNSGGTVRSDERMRVYIDWFERQAGLDSHPPTYNLSSTGVALRNIPYASLDAILAHPSRAKRVRERIRAAVRRPTPDRAPLIAQQLELLSKELTQLEQLAERATELLRTDELQPELRAKLDDLDRRIRAVPHRDVAGFFLQNIREALGSSDDPLSGSRAFYAELVQSARFHRKEIGTALNRLRKARLDSN